MRSVFDTCLVLIFAISGYFGTINSYGIFRSKSRTMTKSGMYVQITNTHLFRYKISLQCKYIILTRIVWFAIYKGCVYDGRVVLDGETIAIPGSCQTLKCYGNKFQKSNKGLQAPIK